MRYRLLSAALVLAFSQAANAATSPAIELELVTERGVQITAPQEWLQLLAGIGIEHVQIRGGGEGDQPQITNRNSGRTATYHVVGVLTSKGQLQLPGGTFTKTDRAKLKDYFAQLGADGADAVAAPHIRFGLTEKELTAVLADLAQPIDFETKDLTPRAFLDRLQTKLTFKPSIDADAEQTLRAASPAVDDFKAVSAGTALAITLRNCGLVMRPEKKRGQPVAYSIVVAGPDVVRARMLGKMTSPDMQYWPIGWQSEKSPGEMAPALFQSRNAEIDGFSLQEALDAIAPLVKIPMYFDRAALKAHQVDPTMLQVKLARTKTSYKRVIDRILSQAHLASEMRTDEAGVPFLWITR
jgi:hypothetical protein